MIAVDAEREVTMSGKVSLVVSVAVVLVGLAVSWNVATANVLAGDSLAIYRGAQGCPELCKGPKCDDECTASHYGDCQTVSEASTTCMQSVGHEGEGCEAGPQGAHCPKASCKDV